MLQLSLLRHAKSSWKNPALADFDRPLSTRGQVAAPLVGQAIAARGLTPDLAICSSARRTRETLDLILPSLSPRPQLRYEDMLYQAEPDAILDLLRRERPETRHMLLIGHNPSLHALAYELIGSGPLMARDRLSTKFPTCGLASLRFHAGTWEEIAYGTGELTLYLVPSDLGLTPSPIDP